MEWRWRGWTDEAHGGPRGRGGEDLKCELQSSVTEQWRERRGEQEEGEREGRGKNEWKMQRERERGRK